MIDFVRVGEKITKYRKKLNMTQDDLADKLYVTRQALSKWECGSSVPSADTLLDLCKIFNVSFEELLCLDEEIEINPDDVFKGHDRLFVVKGICDGNIKVNLPNVFYQFSPSERMVVLKAIKDKKIEIDITELWPKLTMAEQKFIFKER